MTGVHVSSWVGLNLTMYTRAPAKIRVPEKAEFRLIPYSLDVLCQDSDIDEITVFKMAQAC